MGDGQVERGGQVKNLEVEVAESMAEVDRGCTGGVVSSNRCVSVR